MRRIKIMLTWTLIFVAVSIMCGGFTELQAAEAATRSQERNVYLFSFFRDNGQDGLYLAWSEDGLKWNEIKPPGKSFLQPVLGTKLMRDPCIRQGPDGMFHLVWTTGWQDRIIGYAHSRDLVNWSEQKAVPVMMHEPKARNAWAPELFYDDVSQQYLIFWATTIPGRFPETELAGDDKLNHRIYYVNTRDFKTFSETRLLYDGGFNVIDATLLKAQGQYWLVVKDETLKPARKNLRLANSKHAEGPFGPAGEAFTMSWVEGPSAIQIGEDFVVYFDHYAKPQYYGAARSKDLKTWEDISKQLAFPPGVRHGTMIRISRRVVEALQK